MLFILYSPILLVFTSGAGHSLSVMKAAKKFNKDLDSTVVVSTVHTEADYIVILPEHSHRLVQAFTWPLLTMISYLVDILYICS